MDKGRFLIEMHLRTGRPMAELAKAHGVHRSGLYKRLRRYRLEGEAGLEPRSRRPKRSPSRIADLYEDEIIALRKELLDAGFDGGARPSIPWPRRRRSRAVGADHLAGARARGFVTPQPHKRPKSSLDCASWRSSPTSAGRPT